MAILPLAVGLLALLPTASESPRSPHGPRDELLALEPLVIRATRPRFSAHAQRLSLIHAAEIRRSGASNLAQLLKQQSGLSVREYGAAGSLATLTMRGSLGEGILVLRDDVRLNSPERGGVDLSSVSLLGVERVEILHGAASGLYGSEAVGGVVNLVSAKDGVNRLEAGLGTWGFQTLKTEVGAQFGTTRYALGLHRNTAANDYPYVHRGAAAPRENDALEATELWLGVDHPTPSGDIRLNVSVDHRDKGLPGPVNFPSPQANQQTSEAQAAARWNQWLQPNLSLTTALSHHRAEMRFSDPQSIYARQSQSLLNSSDVQSQLLWLSEANELRVGGGFRLDRVLGSNVGSRERALTTAFLHDTVYLTPELTGFGNLRLDHHPGFGLASSPRLGLTYQLVPPLRLRASLGRAYRAPSLNDLYWPRLGNPDLRPERTEVYELGLDAQEGPVSVESTLFFNRGLDAILWQPGAGGDWSPLNIGLTETRGLETKASWRLVDALSLAAGATWLSAIDAGKSGATAGKALLYRPSVVADLSLTYQPVSALTTVVGWSFTGERYTTAQNTDSLPAHDLFSASLAYALDDRNTLSLRGENLANRFYVLQPYYPMPGRTFSASWTIRF